MNTRPARVAEVIDALFDRSWNPELERFRSPFAFRGLSSTALDLSTSLCRLAEQGDLDAVELALVRNFRKYAHGASAGDSVWHWLTLGQHYGLPTRLIDWTYSPLVALHFACERLDQDVDGVVWCIDFGRANRLLPPRLRDILDAERSQTLTLEMLQEFPTLQEFDALSEDPLLVFVEPPSLDARIVNQFALFSLMSSAHANLDAWVCAHPDLVRRVVIAHELKWEIRDKLDQANVTERTLFPGLEGLSRWLTRYYLPQAAKREGHEKSRL
jgi:hypothetical protein